MSRFMFFIAGSGRILGGTQDTLEVLSESGEADMGDRNVSLGHIMDEATQEALMSAAETAFNKNNGQLMKFITVSLVRHARGRSARHITCIQRGSGGPPARAALQVRKVVWRVFPYTPQIPFRNVSNAYATRCGAPSGNTIMVEACLQVTLFLEDGVLMPRMDKESFR